MHEALTDSRPLTRTLWLKPKCEVARIDTLSDTAIFIIKMPSAFDGLLWQAAGAALEAAAIAQDNDDLLRYATESMAEALRTDDFLLEDDQGESDGARLARKCIRFRE